MAAPATGRSSSYRLFSRLDAPTFQRSEGASGIGGFRDRGAWRSWLSHPNGFHGRLRHTNFWTDITFVVEAVHEPILSAFDKCGYSMCGNIGARPESASAPLSKKKTPRCLDMDFVGVSVRAWEGATET